MAEFSDYSWLVGDGAAPWLERAAGDSRPILQLLTALRKDLSADRAALVVEQVDLRRRAAEKFGGLAERMFFTPTLLEQATDLPIARYKADRFRRFVGDGLILDGCCGIGGDALGLAEAGAVAAHDLSAVACLFAAANLRAAWEAERAMHSVVHCGDLAHVTPSRDDAWHIDPDRRAAGKRSIAAELMSPGPEIVRRWFAAAPRGAVKLAPATDLPDVWPEAIEREWISSRRQCRQQVAWFGDMATAPGRRRATLIGSNAKSRSGEDPAESSGGKPSDITRLGGNLAVPWGTFVGLPNTTCESCFTPARFVFDADPAIHAAELLGAVARQYGLATLGAGGSYLTGDELIDDPLLAAFEVCEVVPLRTAEVKAALAQRQIGRLEVKQRGVDVDPDRFRKQLALRGDRPGTIVLARAGVQQMAIVVERR